MDLLLHKNFSLDGKSFLKVEELLSFTHKNLPEVHTFLINWFDDTEFISVNTSGSTGKPKQIKLKKEYMLNSALATGKFFDLADKTSALLCMPVKYIAGKMMLVRALVLGWHLDVKEASSNPLQNINKRYDFSAMVPLQLHNSSNKIHLIKKLIVGGGIVSDELIIKIKTIPTEIYASFGMTETITHIALKPLNLAAIKNQKSIYYHVLPNVTIAKDQRDCLVIDAPSLSDKSIVTNDLVDIKSNCEFEWIGRYDNIINSGGIKLIPEQIEIKLFKYINQRFFITAMLDNILGEKLILIIEGSNLDIDLNKFKDILTKYEVPKEVFFIDKFVETETKKIDRKRTKNMLKII